MHFCLDFFSYPETTIVVADLPYFPPKLSPHACTGIQQKAIHTVEDAPRCSTNRSVRRRDLIHEAVPLFSRSYSIMKDEG